MQGRDIAIVVGAIALVVLLLGVLGGGMMGPGMMGWGGFGFSPLWWVFMLLFWVLIISGGAMLLIWLFRQAQPTGAGPGPTTSRPLDILRERYARGEITREQYEEMRRDLEQE
ncbi:MAG: SHOCT domain-containing protein [Chloroflexota bacterium]